MQSQRLHVHMQDVQCSFVLDVLVADYAKVVEANVVIIFRIVVLEHQRRPQVAVSRLIQFKALELLGTHLFAGRVDLMLEAAHVLCLYCLGGTVVHLHASAKHSCRKLLLSDNHLPDCNHVFVLELLGIILCMAGRVIAKFAALKLDIVFGHNKSEHAQASGTPAHRTFINSKSDAALLPYFHNARSDGLGWIAFLNSKSSISFFTSSISSKPHFILVHFSSFANRPSLDRHIHNQVQLLFLCFY
jgi:hypothetical protein